MRILDRAKERIGRIKADRSTEMGVAGHQAAMKSLGNATGWERHGSRSLLSVKGKDSTKSAATPGFGHVVVNDERLGYEGIDQQVKGK